MSLTLSPPMSLIQSPRAAGPVPVTITGTITDSSGRPACSGWIEFLIQPESQSLNYSVLPDINVATPTRGRIVAGGQMVSDCSSMAPFEVWPNDLILPSNTLYQITIAPWGQVTKVLNGVLISSSVNPQSIANLTFVSPQDQVIGSVVNANPLVTMTLVPGTSGSWTVGDAQNYYAAGYFNTLYCSNIVPPPSAPYVLESSNVFGQPGSGQIVLLYTFVAPTVFPANFSSPTSYGSCITAPKNLAVYTCMLQPAGSSTSTTVGTVSIFPSGAFTFSTPGFTGNPGDMFWVTAPNPADPTLSDVALSFVGTQAS